MIAVDIDGTLLNSQGFLTDKTRAAMLAAVKAGVIFTICTGRPLQGVRQFNDLFDRDLPFILYNGALVTMGKSLRCLFNCCLKPDDARRIFEQGVLRGTTQAVWALLPPITIQTGS